VTNSIVASSASFSISCKQLHHLHIVFLTQLQRAIRSAMHETSFPTLLLHVRATLCCIHHPSDHLCIPLDGHGCSVIVRALPRARRTRLHGCRDDEFVSCNTGVERVFWGLHCVERSRAAIEIVSWVVSTCHSICGDAFDSRSFFRGVLAILGGLSVTYYHNLASLHAAGMVWPSRVMLAELKSTS
jgi:hypothetical protein